MGPDGTTQTEERLFISSLEPDPEQFLEAVRHHWHSATTGIPPPLAFRHHWHVENKLHWTLDVAFEEDLSRVRTGHAAQNLGIVRRLALSLLKQETSRLLKQETSRLLKQETSRLLKQETSRSVGVKLKRKDAGWNSDYLLKVLTAGN